LHIQVLDDPQDEDAYVVSPVMAGPSSLPLSKQATDDQEIKSISEFVKVFALELDPCLRSLIGLVGSFGTLDDDAFLVVLNRLVE
jgi:hypothetical protein